jgi:hypothetical protein
VSRTYPLDIIPGDTEVRDIDTELNLTGATVQALIVCHETSEIFLADVDVVDAVNGDVTLTWSKEQTSAIARAFRHGAGWALTFTDPDEAVSTILHGEVSLDLE